MDKIEVKLSIYFAIVACLCGLAFLGSPELGALPIIAIFFAVFGLVFVDLLKWFALPTTMAYLALGAIAFYTINRFFRIGEFSPEPQMITVAELLVLVQSVLMLQRKNRRIYEQLAVFAMLQLIVAAIFNNAITYGLLLLPLGVAIIGALSLLHICSTSEEAFEDLGSRTVGLRVHSPDSQRSFANAAGVFPRIGWMTIAPSVLVVAFVFFYALPRTNHQARHGIGGKAQVGFSSQVSLGQIGQMLQNPEIAVRIDVNERRSGARYDVVGDFYLRGAVLEKYNTQNSKLGIWGAVDGGRLMEPRQLPPASPMQRVNSLIHDDVQVKLNVSPMNGDSLFSIPPYFFDSSGPEVIHQMDRWLISRRIKPIITRNSQISYRFGTHAFRGGIQSKFSPRFSEREKTPESEVSDFSALGTSSRYLSQEEEEEARYRAVSRADEIRSAENYKRICLEYDVDKVPSAVRTAETGLGRMQKNQDNPSEVAKQLEQFLASGRTYRYTLDLTMAPIVGIDPIEQFLTVDRRGNCQYFASALVLMLRSQGIPARLVVGFNTDEFNSIGGYYIARQLHAHAWVEALVDAKWLSPNDRYYPDQPVDEYWMRLDPTPGGGSGTNQSPGGRVSNVLDMAQDIWTSYVVDADASDRRRELGVGSEGISGSYQQYYEWLKLTVSRVRAGELGAGALADRNLFSWPSAVAAMVILLAGLLVYQLGLPRWRMHSRDSEAVDATVSTPSIGFFAETVSLLETLGMRRRKGQTPKEYTTAAASKLMHENSASLAAPLTELTSAFYLERFGHDASSEGAEASATRDHRIKLALSRVRERVAELTASKDRESPRNPSV